MEETRQMEHEKCLYYFLQLHLDLKSWQLEKQQANKNISN